MVPVISISRLHTKSHSDSHQKHALLQKNKRWITFPIFFEIFVTLPWDLAIMDHFWNSRKFRETWQVCFSMHHNRLHAFVCSSHTYTLLKCCLHNSQFMCSLFYLSSIPSLLCPSITLLHHHSSNTTILFLSSFSILHISCCHCLWCLDITNLLQCLSTCQHRKKDCWSYGREQRRLSTDTSVGLSH